jgi:hypothetical protein
MFAPTSDQQSHKCSLYVDYHVQLRSDSSICKPIPVCHSLPVGVSGVCWLMNNALKVPSHLNFGLENREYSHGDPLHQPCDTLYLQNLALTSPMRRSHGRYSSLVDSGHRVCFCFVWVFKLPIERLVANMLSTMSRRNLTLCTTRWM